MSEGWIKLHKKITEWEWFDDANMVHVWIHLLLWANWKETKWHGVTIPRGSLVITLSDLAKRLKMSVRQIRTCLQRLEEGKQIDKQTTNKFTIVNICNYDRYQLREEDERQANDKQTTNKRQTSSCNAAEFSELQAPKKERIYIYSNANTAACAREDESEIDYPGFVTYFNAQLREAGARIRPIQTISRARREEMAARVAEVDAARPDEPGAGLRALRTMAEKAARSDFLNGRATSGIIRGLDFMLRPDIFPKIIEGQYDDNYAELARQQESNNIQTTTQTNNGTTRANRRYSEQERRVDEAEQRLVARAARLFGDPSPGDGSSTDGDGACKTF